MFPNLYKWVLHKTLCCQALGSDLVSCLLSRNWSVREAGLKHLSKEVVATLIKGAGEGRSGAVVSPVRRAVTHSMLQTACDILAYMCADPVYRVFVASLVSFNNIGCSRSVRVVLKSGQIDIAPNGTNLWLFKIRFQYILAKMYWNLTWKSHWFVPFWAPIWHPWAVVMLILEMFIVYL